MGTTSFKMVKEYQQYKQLMTAIKRRRDAKSVYVGKLIEIKTFLEYHNDVQVKYAQFKNYEDVSTDEQFKYLIHLSLQYYNGKDISSLSLMEILYLMNKLLKVSAN